MATFFLSASSKFIHFAVSMLSVMACACSGCCSSFSTKIEYSGPPRIQDRASCNQERRNPIRKSGYSEYCIRTKVIRSTTKERKTSLRREEIDDLGNYQRKDNIYIYPFLW